MNVYRITSETVGHTKYPWVGGWGPLASMPFFDDFPEDCKEMKIKSWNLNRPPPGLKIDPGGKVWSDVIGCGGGPPSFFVSDRILSDLENEGIPVYRSTEMPIAKNLSKQLQDVPPPKYYVLEAEPGISWNFEAMGVQLSSKGIPIYDPVHPPEHIADLSSWNGSDLFCLDKGRLKVSIMCNDRIKNMAIKHEWTNIRFNPVKVL